MAKELKSTDGFFTQGWMRTQLHLAGGELSAYALVHQFSQSNAGRYLGGPGYLAAWLGCSENTARKYLHSLQEKGLIINIDREENGVLFRDYVVNYEPLQKFGAPSNNLGTPLQKFGVEYNLKETPKGVNISIPPTPTKDFNFRESVIGLGVTAEVTDAWLKVRKNKKATNSKIAFDDVAKEVALAQQAGHSANECIKFAVVKSWAGFKWEWMENEIAGGSRSPRPAAGRASRRSGTAVDRMLEVGAEIFCPQKPAYDEQ